MIQEAFRKTKTPFGGRPLALFGLPLAPFGSLWVSFGSLWAPFGSLRLSFDSLWLPLAPFGRPLDVLGGGLDWFWCFGAFWWAPGGGFKFSVGFGGARGGFGLVLMFW